MRVVGVDPSATSTAAVLLFGNTLEYAINEYKFPGTGMPRAMAIQVAFGKMLDQYKPDLAVIEGYGFGNKFTLVPIVEVGTLLRQSLLARGIKCVAVPPTTVKKFVVGTGDAKKEDMKLYAWKRWGFEHLSNDVVDAYCLGVAGLVASGEVPGTKADKATLKKVVADICTT